MTWLLILMACVDEGKDSDQRDTAETTDTGDGEDSGETGITSGSSASLTGDGSFTAASVLYWSPPDWSEQTVGPEILITEWVQSCEDLVYYSGDPSLEGEGRYIYLMGYVACNDGIDDGSPEWSSCEDVQPTEGTYDRMSVDDCSGVDSSEACRFITLANVGTAQGPAEAGGFTWGDYTEATEVTLTINLYDEDEAEGSLQLDGLEGTFTSVTNCGSSEAGE
ncbi:MAG: hypothetical protein AAB558_02985 [Patescibacteria group bacterium]